MGFLLPEAEHLPAEHAPAGFQPVEVNAGSEVRGVESHLMMTGRDVFVHQLLHDAAQ